MIKIENLSKQFETTLAVNDLSLHVEKGELFSFLGPNGAGKTTTIKMMVGLMTPTAGSIQMGGFDVAQEAKQAKSIIGYVPDSAFLYQHLTGVELLMMVGQLYDMDNASIQKELNNLSEQIFINEWLRYFQTIK